MMIVDLFRLARAGLSLAGHGVRIVPKGDDVPLILQLGRVVGGVWWVISWPFRDGRRTQSPIAAALTDLGPSYIKLGQFMATRPDLVPPDLVSDLAELRDRLPPFSDARARRTIQQSLSHPVDTLFETFGPAVAAASIAQVHKARVRPRTDVPTAAVGGDSPSGGMRDVAVKVLRPGIEQRFANDLSSFYLAARTIEQLHPPTRRLRPVAVVDTLARSTALEMDLRLEAAAVSEFAANTKNDDGFRVPKVDWQRTSKRVMTVEWVDGTPIADLDALRAAGHDLEELGTRIIRIFLNHAMRDGVFHADMHPGNLFVDPAGNVVAIDFGIIGRLGPRERRFLAEILYGFIAQDYRRAAEVHFWAGYVPGHHSVDTFAQALRAVAEPILDRPADEISMGHLLGQLFEYTDVFDMKTRPELILLQKTMVVVEGVARMLNPSLNMWTAGEPVVRAYLARELGPVGQLSAARDGLRDLSEVASGLPELMVQAERTARALGDVVSEGRGLDEDAVMKLVERQNRPSLSQRAAWWVGAGSLLAIALHLWL